MKKQIPRGDPDLVCPLHKLPMEQVCHTCPLWVELRGTDPNSGQDVDQWNCSLAFLPMLLIEGASQSRQTTAAVQSFRNATLREAERRVVEINGGVRAIER